MGRDDMYKSSEKKFMLSLLSNLYSELDVISVSASRLLSCSILHCLLTTVFKGL